MSVSSLTATSETGSARGHNSDPSRATISWFPMNSVSVRFSTTMNTSSATGNSVATLTDRSAAGTVRQYNAATSPIARARPISPAPRNTSTNELWALPSNVPRACSTSAMNVGSRHAAM
jgi:hypothetical protein